MNLAKEIRQIVVKNLETPEGDLAAREYSGTSRQRREVHVENLRISGTPASDKFLIVYDEQTELAKALFKAYCEVLPGARKISFYDLSAEEVLAEVNKCVAGNLVILIQSSSFRMSNFRWRLELFNRKLRVIEHAHLVSNLPEEASIYLDTLKYDGDYYEQVVAEIKPLLEASGKIAVRSLDGSELIYEGGVEKVKKNTGDFSGLANKGCGYPIGEMFTEPLDLARVNGAVQIFAFADINHRMVFPKRSFRLKVVNGCVTTDDADFGHDDSEAALSWQEVMKLISTENPDGLVWMRELGFGLNRALSKQRRLTDISAYERVSGVHISLGLKHDIYRDKVGKEKTQRFHIDIFPDVDTVKVDGRKIFAEGKYLI